MSELANTPKPPYFAVIFTNQRSDMDHEAYANTADTMVETAAKQDGFLGIESTRSEDGFGITVSYWRDEASLIAWKENLEHKVAQRLGMEKWYADYYTRVAEVKRAYRKQRAE